MQFIEVNELGRALQLILGKVEIALETQSPNGIMLDLGNKLVKYIYSFETRINKSKALGNQWLHYDYYTLPLNSNIRVAEVYEATVNIEGDDVLLNKTASVKKINNAAFRIDYAGIASTATLSDSAKRCRITFSLIFRRE